MNNQGWLSDKVIYEAFEYHYKDYPHYREIQEAIWELFEKQEHIWFSDIRTIAANLSLDVGLIRGYISLTTEDNYKPQLLSELFYRVDKNGQLNLIELSTEDLLVLTLATMEITNPRKNNKPSYRKFKLAQEATINWLKSTFICWQDIGRIYEPTLDSSFNNPNNSLWILLEHTNL